MAAGVEALVMDSSSPEAVSKRGGADERLLAEYARSGSHDALAQIVERHSSMVYATCLRILGERSIAEDASQAAFLVLVRKSKSLPANTLLGPWLYQAARNVALAMRRADSRRVRREHEAAEMAKTSTAMANSDHSGLSSEVDAVLATLPTAQRNAVVLRYFYGYSAREAAQKLGCPEETLHTRVTRALNALRERFGQRGVVTSTVVMAALLAEQSAHAAPAGLAASITQVCAGKAVASAAVVSTADALLKTMAFAKAKAAALVVSGVLILGAPAAYFGVQAMKETPAAAVHPSTNEGPAAEGRPSQAPTAAPAFNPILSTFDFEDGLTRPEWTGKIVPSPDKQNDRCISAVRVRGTTNHLNRVKLCHEQDGLFNHRKDAVLAFDYWVDEKVEAIDIWFWNRTQQFASGANPLFDLPRRKWTRVSIPLAEVGRAEGEKLLEGDLITEIVIQTGGEKGEGALYVDNIIVSVPTLNK